MFVSSSTLPGSLCTCTGTSSHLLTWLLHSALLRPLLLLLLLPWLFGPAAAVAPTADAALLRLAVACWLLPVLLLPWLLAPAAAVPAVGAALLRLAAGPWLLLRPAPLLLLLLLMLLLLPSRACTAAAA
jgi:hypothetical protein